MHLKLNRILTTGHSECACIVADGRQGFEADGPYDAIHVGAAADSLPQKVCFPISFKIKNVFLIGYMLRT